MARIQKRWPGGLGIVALVQMLRGAKDQKPWSAGWTEFPTYGIMRDVPPQRMRLYLDALQEQGYLAETGDEFPVITLTAKLRRCFSTVSRLPCRSAPPPRRKPRPSAVLPAKRRLPAPHFRKRTIRCWQA